MEIENILAAEKPHMFGLSEANLKKDTDIYLVLHAVYTLHSAHSTKNRAPSIRYSHDSVIHPLILGGKEKT